MSSFFELVRFEYKKMFQRKSTIAAFVLIGILIIAASIGTVTGDHYYHSSGNNISSFEAMKLDRAVKSSTHGLLDENHISQAITQNEIMIHDDNNTVGLVLLLSVAICVAPVFSEEYQTRTASVMLSSRYGKNKVIWAKIFAGLSFTFVLAISVTSIFLLSVLSLLGFDGSDVSIQIINPLSTYPVTMLDACLILAIVTIFASLMLSMMTMMFSSMFRSAFGVIIISFMLLFLPIFISVSPRNYLLYTVLRLIPIKMMSFSAVFSEYLFDVFGRAIIPSVFYPVFCIVTIVFVIPFAYRSFKNHQIG